MRFANGMRGIDLDFDVQSMVCQQRGGQAPIAFCIAHELRWLCQAHLSSIHLCDESLAPARFAEGKGRDLGIRPLVQRHGGIQKVIRSGDHFFAAHGIVRRALFRAASLGNHVCSIQRVVQTAPARIRRVQAIPRIIHGHDQLRAGQRCNFRIDSGRQHLKMIALGQQVPDVLQKCSVRAAVYRLPFARNVPRIDLGLQGIALFQ